VKKVKKTKAKTSAPVVVHFNADISEADIGAMPKREKR
jgi:hypothetical protein